MAKRKAKKSDRIKISACYMVKNAAKDLRRSLESLAKHVDEIIVVDTGSTDDTVAVAEEFGAKIFHEPWQNDFSTPRNIALRAASGDWIVFLDADEFFVNDTAKNLRAAVKRAQSHGVTGVMVKLFNVDEDNDFKIIEPDYALRLFENAPEVRYVGKIHEDIYRGEKILTNIKALPADMLTLWHTGYSASIIKSKLERNLKLLLEELHKSDAPERTYPYLADCYFGLRDFANAEKFARFHVDTVQSMSTRSIKILLECLSKDEARFDEYFSTCKTAVERYPKIPEFSFKLAECFAKLEKYREAVNEINHALMKAENYGEQVETSNFDAENQERARQLLDEWQLKIPLTPEEKRRTIGRLINELIHAQTIPNNKENILRLSKKILSLKPEEARPFEKVAANYIDYEMTDEAEEVVSYLEKNFPPTPYCLLLRARIFFLKNNCLETVKTAERALTLEGISLLITLKIENLIGQAYRIIGDSKKGIIYYRQSVRLNLSDIKDPLEFTQAASAQREEYSNYLFNLHNLNITREEIFKETCGFNKLLAHIPRFNHSRKKHARHKKIRVGYISPDIYLHVVAFFSTHLFTNYDKTRFEVFIYANNTEDYITEQFKSNVDCFRLIFEMNARDVANQIVADEIDILFDLAGHTANNLLEVMAYKPAPIQISGIGYFDSTGLDTIDYFLADKFTDPEGLNESFFTEKILRLQHSHFCYVWHDFPFMTTPAPCTKNGFVTFVSFNNFAKVTDEILNLWAKILDGVPNSRLYLKGKSFQENCGLDFARERLTAAGIDLNRVDLEDFTLVYVKNYERADIALDTFPYPGGGTTCDALYMGVPVITLVGERHNSRFGYSLLMNMGLGELCAFSEEEYVQKAIELANDRERLREYHLTIRRKMEQSPVMDDTIYMGELEQAYEKIFSAWVKDKPLPNFPQEPAPIDEKLAEEYYKRAMSYLPLEEEAGESKYHRVDYKRTLYFAELAAQFEPKRDAKLLLTMADRSFYLNDNIAAYNYMREAVEKIYSSEENFPAKFLSECHKKLATYAQNNGLHVEAVENYGRAIEFADDETKRIELYDALLLNLHFLDISGEELSAFHFDYQKFFADIKPFTTYHEPHERIKVGYISGDFRKHAAFAVVFGFISCHDRSKFEIFCYSRNPADDDYTDFYRRGVEHFVDVRGMSNLELAKKIHDDEIDIAFDLAGHTGCNGLPALAYRPAPVQMCGVGYMSTTGLKEIDYFLTDEILDPIGEHEDFFSEKLLYMPAQFSYARREDLKPSDGAPCIANGYVTFGTICRYSKINDDMLAIWTEILRRVPTAKLLMRAQEYISESTVDVLYEKLKSLGCDVERVIFRPAVPDYFGAIGKLDIILDAYPYVGGATTLDALYMGVPVVNFYGERHSTRFGKSILASVGLDELSVNSVEDYINRAVALASDFETLDVLHKNLRQMFLQSAALDPMKYCRLLERKFEEILSERLAKKIEPPN